MIVMSWAGIVAQWVEVLATRPNDLSSNPSTHAMEKDKLSSDLHMCTVAYRCMHTDTHTHKHKKKPKHWTVMMAVALNTPKTASALNCTYTMDGINSTLTKLSKQ